jgi:hypothetical protein
MTIGWEHYQASIWVVIENLSETVRFEFEVVIIGFIKYNKEFFLSLEQPKMCVEMVTLASVV